MTKALPSLEVHWGGADGARDIIVGYLEFDGKEWSFQYADGVEEAPRLTFDGFQGLPRTAAGAEPARSSSLFPAFAARIPQLKRADVVRICGDLTALPREEAFYEFLRRSGGRTGTDQIWFTELTRKASRESEGLGKALRNDIRKMVTAIRRLLEDDVRQQLEGTFGILPDGRILDQKLVNGGGLEILRDREAIESAIRYDVATGRSPKEAVERFTRDAGFTCLNRLAALKMMEARGLVQESVSRGRESSGFRLFKRVCEEVCASQPDGGYRRYLELLFDDVAAEVRVLFDRTLPHSRIFPRPGALNQVLDLLNQSCPANVWMSDETIGWIYQYFTPKEDREALRDPKQGGSQAPRNSYELAVRNQFYTPRYVVEFLTDNTLGRTWYEMRKGQTRLVEICQYLVRRPNENFLAPGETPPESPSVSGLSQEELLRLPVAISHRPIKDPRDIRILDPACGSGHFLLYAFDLLLVIYEEAWADLGAAAFTETGRPLREDYPDIGTLRRELPGLILRHNLHGIDIDLRATQIAALALWLRAQRAYQELGLKPFERPPIRRSNIVCAEPMPGDRALRDEFLGGLQPPVLRQLVRVVFDKMALAGEAGSLLKIEEEVAGAVDEARSQWAAGTKAEQMLLWPEAKRPNLEPGMLFDTSGVTEEAFWQDAEERLLDELRRYARHAENGRGVARYLFAEDAAQGFAFVDLCRKQFDVILMNPPFGQSTAGLRGYLESINAVGREDLGMAMVAAGSQRLAARGLLGALTSRTYLAIPTAQAWRDRVLLGARCLYVLADLGYGVLDSAMVEAASYIIGSAGTNHMAAFFSALEAVEKDTALRDGLSSLTRGDRSGAFVLHELTSFLKLEGHVLCYWLPAEILARVSMLPTLAHVLGEAKTGLNTGDDFRFLRVPCEVSPSEIGPGNARWAFCCKGGEYAPFFDDVDVLLNWFAVSSEMRHVAGARVFNTDLCFRTGVVYPMRTTSDLSPRPLAPNCCFNKGAQILPISDQTTAAAFIALAYTRPFKLLVEAMYGGGDVSVSGSAARNYTGGVLNGLPLPALAPQARIRLAELYQRAARHIIRWKTTDELSCFFSAPPARLESTQSIRETAAHHLRKGIHTRISVGEIAREADDAALSLYGFDAKGREALRTLWGAHPYEYPTVEDKSLRDEIKESVDGLIEKMATGQWSLDVEIEGSRRLVTKKGYFSDRILEIAAHTYSLHPSSLAPLVWSNRSLLEAESQATATIILSYGVGCAFARWDVRPGCDASLIPPAGDPFGPLPVCPPAMLLGPNGLPAAPGTIVSEEWLHARPDVNMLPPEGAVKSPTISDNEYPLPNLSWDGILVDDEGHASDIVARVREVLRLLWEDRADEIGWEACEILGVKDLRSYFRNSRNFFDHHIKRYSKSRRKAPIYWLLQSARKSYGVWIYYHRLTRDTLFHLLQSYVEPKIEHEEGRRHELRRLYEAAKAAKAGTEERRLAKEVDSQETLVGELADFKAKIEAAAYGRLPGAEPGCPGWDPDLNDGVILNIAPLHGVVPWKEAAKAWEELAEGRYDWSHVALRFWPTRVEAKCREDRSIAVAHGREAR